jgi:ubiquinone/menaquinone biosynthesis C-methylase UbiE
MKRLFSVPGLRWRGRIKQFEKAVYDDWAVSFDRSIWATWCRRWVESFAREVPERSAILDIGCGTGNALLILADRHPTRLAGIDISPGAIAVAAARLAGLGADLRVQDAEVGLPWPDRSFDVATMTATVHHFPHPEKVVSEVSRVLKPGGRIVIAEPWFFFPVRPLQNLLLRVYPLNGDLHFFSPRGLRRLVERCGFRTLAQRRAAFFARYIVAQKA